MGGVEAKQSYLLEHILQIYKSTFTQFERTSREASRSYLLPVHESTAVQLHSRRIVHQSSDQVCVPRHNIVVLSLHFTPSLSQFYLFPTRERIIHYGKPVRFSLSSLFLSSSSFHLRRTIFFFLPQLFRHHQFLSLLSHLDPFSPSSIGIRLGDNNRRTNGANLQSRLANGRSRDARYLCQTGQKKKRSFRTCP